MEFSKKVLVASYIIGILIILYAMGIQLVFILKDYHGDSGIVIGLITGAFAEMGVCSGFYKWKAKAENMLKIKQSHGDNENAVEMIEEKEEY